MARHRVGDEIGEVHPIARRPVADGQHRPVIRGRDARPVLAVLRGDGVVAAPALRVGRSGGILDAEHAVPARGTIEAKVEPLKEHAACVGHDLQPDPGRRGRREAAYVAAVEIAVDREGHGRPRRSCPNAGRPASGRMAGGAVHAGEGGGRKAPLVAPGAVVPARRRHLGLELRPGPPRCGESPVPARFCRPCRHRLPPPHAAALPCPASRHIRYEPGCKAGGRRPSATVTGATVTG